METIANHEFNNVQKREERHPKLKKEEQWSGARPGGGGKQVRAVGGVRIMWQLEDKVKQLELQAARGEEPIEQFKVEKMMWLEQQEQMTTIPSGQCMGGKTKNPHKQE